MTLLSDQNKKWYEIIGLNPIIKSLISQSLKNGDFEFLQKLYSKLNLAILDYEKYIKKGEVFLVEAIQQLNALNEVFDRIDEEEKKLKNR